MEEERKMERRGKWKGEGGEERRVSRKEMGGGEKVERRGVERRGSGKEMGGGKGVERRE